MLTTNSLLSSLIYPKKKIDSTAILYKFIHFRNISIDTLKPSANNFDDDELSCDWNKYSTPEKTRNLLSKQYSKGTDKFKNPLNFFICKLEVGKLLNTNPTQNFEHDPIFHFPKKIGSPNNRAHSLIIGKKDKGSKEILKSRGQIAMNAKWVIFDEMEFKGLIAQHSPNA